MKGHKKGSQSRGYKKKNKAKRKRKQSMLKNQQLLNIVLTGEASIENRDRLDSFFHDDQSILGSRDENLAKDEPSAESVSMFGVGIEFNTFEISKMIVRYYEMIGTKHVDMSAMRSISGRNAIEAPKVYVVSFSDCMILEKFKVCCMLWDLQLEVTKQ